MPSPRNKRSENSDPSRCNTHLSGVTPLSDKPKNIQGFNHTRGTTPVTWPCTSYVALHPSRTGAMPTDRVHRPHQQAQPRIRTPPHGQALHHWACAHVVEGLFMLLWSRPLIVAGIGVVSQGPEESQAAVPAGGGRAWPDNEPVRHHTQHRRHRRCGGRRRVRRARAGFEIDHSEPQARVWRSRGRPGPTAPGTPAGQQARRSRPAPQGLGGSRVRPLGGSQRLFQRIWVPSEPRRWQASTTRAAMPASADLPHVRGSYCFLTPTSPSILRTPS